MGYLGTARKWRPRRFGEVVGQEHITATLENALKLERIAQSYLLCGPRGVGKTTTARILAKVLNCPQRQGGDPCDQCSSCRSIAAGTSMNVLEIDGASNNKVEHVRALREVVRYAPTEGRYKIYIIDEVHMLTTAAFNALLKTLEEPPPRVVFIFATTEVQELPETILSRCQRFNFRLIASGQIAAHLEKIARAEGIEIAEEALYLLAGRAGGALRDAESLFDQVVSFARDAVRVEDVRQVLGLVDQHIYFELSRALAASQARQVLELVEALVDAGGDLEEFVRGFVEHLRHLLFVKVQGAAQRLEVAQSERPRYEDLASELAEEDLVRMLRALMDLSTELRRSLQPRFRLELELVRLARMGRASDIGELLSRIERLETSLKTGGARAASSPVPAAATPAKPSSRVAAAPRVPAPAPEEAPSLERIGTDWEGLVREMRQRQPPLGLFLQGAALLGLEGGVLKLGFAPDERFSMSEVSKNRQSVEALFEQNWGWALRLQCVELEGKPPREGKPPLHADPTVKSVLDSFDGELI